MGHMTRRMRLAGGVLVAAALLAGYFSTGVGAVTTLQLAQCFNEQATLTITYNEGNGSIQNVEVTGVPEGFAIIVTLTNFETGQQIIAPLTTTLTRHDLPNGLRFDPVFYNVNGYSLGIGCGPYSGQ